MVKDYDNPKKATLHIRLTPGVKAGLLALADKQGVSMSEMARRLLFEAAKFAK
jgi:hypothetical protein